MSPSGMGRTVQLQAFTRQGMLILVVLPLLLMAALGYVAWRDGGGVSQDDFGGGEQVDDVGSSCHQAGWTTLPRCPGLVPAARSVGGP